MNESLFLCISVIIILIFIYKPIKLYIEKFIDNYISNTINVIYDAKKTHDEAIICFQKLEESLVLQKELSEEKLLQSNYLFKLIKLENEKKITQEIKRQFNISEIERKVSETLLIKETIRHFLLLNMKNIILKINNKIDILSVERALQKIKLLNKKK